MQIEEEEIRAAMIDAYNKKTDKELDFYQGFVAGIKFLGEQVDSFLPLVTEELPKDFIKKETKYYPEIWFKADYFVEETRILFKCYQIESLDELNPEKSKFEEEPSITGFIKWDGTMFFDQGGYYPDEIHIYYTSRLMHEIFRFKREQGGNFEIDY